jgi:hypothetical protein
MYNEAQMDHVGAKVAKNWQQLKDQPEARERVLRALRQDLGLTLGDIAVVLNIKYTAARHACWKYGVTK